MNTIKSTDATYLLDRSFDVLTMNGPTSLLGLCIHVHSGTPPTLSAAEYLALLQADDRFLVHTWRRVPERAVVLAKPETQPLLPLR